MALELMNYPLCDVWVWAIRTFVVLQIYFMYRLPRELREGIVFSHFVHRGVPCDHYLWCIGPHCTDPHSGHGTSLDWTSTPLLMTSGGHHWRPVQTCSLQEPPLPTATGTDIWSLLKYVRLVQAGRTHSTGMQTCVFCWNVKVSSLNCSTDLLSLVESRSGLLPCIGSIYNSNWYICNLSNHSISFNGIHKGFWWPHKMVIKVMYR